MRFDATTEYAASAEKVGAMLANPEYVTKKVEASGPLSFESSVEGDASGPFVVRTRRDMPTDRVPEKFRKFVGASIGMKFDESWSAPAADGGRAGTITLDIVGAPAKANGTATLTPTGPDSCQIVYTGDVKVSIPLIGAKIESVAAGVVQQAVNAEARVGTEWLTQH